MSYCNNKEMFTKNWVTKTLLKKLMDPTNEVTLQVWQSENKCSISKKHWNHNVYIINGVGSNGTFHFIQSDPQNEIKTPIDQKEALLKEIATITLANEAWVLEDKRMESLIEQFKLDRPLFKNILWQTDRRCWF